MLVQLEERAMSSIRGAISLESGYVVLRKRRHFFDRHEPAEKLELRAEGRPVLRIRFRVDAKRGMLFRFAQRRDGETGKNGERSATHGGLIKGLTISATPKAFGAD